MGLKRSRIHEIKIGVHTHWIWFQNHSRRKSYW